MKKLNLIHTVTALIATTLTATAAQIVIPSGSFEGITSSIEPPFLAGTSTGTIGAWSASYSGLLSLGGSIGSGSAGSLGSPTPAEGTFAVRVELPSNVIAQAKLWQVLTNNY